MRIFVNLKRFDVPRSEGGVCPSANPGEWIEGVVEQSIRSGLGSAPDLDLVFLLPEALIVPAIRRLGTASPAARIAIGSQSVYRENVRPGGNFGAFSSNRPAAAVCNLGCTWTMVGHSEERQDLLGVIEAYDPACSSVTEKRRQASDTVDAVINRELHCAFEAGLDVLLCVGEEQEVRVREVLGRQIERNLLSIRPGEAAGRLVIGYEPIWAIGPGKTPPEPQTIDFVSSFIKERVESSFGFSPPVVYGGGLKEENAEAIAAVPSIDGGLVALTRFSGEIGFDVVGLARIIECYRRGERGGRREE